jgi:hypothetical protein
MAKIFGGLLAGLLALSLGLQPLPAGRGKTRSSGAAGPHWLSTNPGKRAGEVLALALSPLWIASVGARRCGARAACLRVCAPAAGVPGG